MRMIEQSANFIVAARPRDWQMFTKLSAPGCKLTTKYIKLSNLQTSHEHYNCGIGSSLKQQYTVIGQQVNETVNQ